MSLQRTQVMAWVLMSLVAAAAAAKKAPTRQFKQILPENHFTQQQKQRDNHMVLSGISRNQHFQLPGSLDAEQIASAYLQDLIGKQPQQKSADIQWQQTGIYQGASVTTVRFKQVHQGYDVFGGEISVSINASGKVVFATHELFAIEGLENHKQRISDPQAKQVVADYFKHPVATAKADMTEQLVIYPHANGAKWAYQIDYQFNQGRGYWQLLIDANDGSVIRAADQLHYVDAPGQVFDPDPLSSAGQEYGGGLVDNNDLTTPELNQQLKAVTLDVLNQNGTFFLTNEWAESLDLDTPNDGDFSQPSNNFNYHRGENSFEAVNVFYHISEYLDYVNNDLGLSVRPYQFGSGVKFDAHGDDGADNSYYNSTGVLVFGEGCVDDAEDADVIIHELGHGIHDWVTLGGLSQVDGLSEGLGDYFAQSYSRSRPGFQWGPNDAHYNHVFSWDGHNECWGGRTTNYNRAYPAGLVGQIHTDGQIWSTCLMKVWDELGQDKTDSMVIEGISMTNSNTSQADAAQAVLQAAAELGYTSDLDFIADTFNACGYDVEAINEFAVSIEASSNPQVIGSAVTFSANIAGGTAPYSYQWDINGDGITDSTAATVTATYAQVQQFDVSVAVAGSAGGSGNASLPVNLAGAVVEFNAAGINPPNLTQVCGNNDAVVDPGERWQAAVSVENIGDRSASDVYLALAKNRNAITALNQDNYGNSVSLCDRSFIDISNSGNLLSWQADGSGFPANDEGSVLIQLSAAFDHYGESVNQLRASTNGYFSTSANANGGDWDNDCPLPATPNQDNVGGRIAALHGDLRSADFYHQFFANCPRAADTGGSLACEVFQWDGADVFGDAMVENIDIQAILYPATSQWVFQYAGTGFDGSFSTTGMQNAAASDGLNFACNSAGSLNDAEAICLFNKNHQAIADDNSWLVVETPVIGVGNLSVGASQAVDVGFAIAEDAACGSTYGINHEASVFNQGFNAGYTNIITGELGNNGSCQVVTSCGVGTTANLSVSNNISPQNGLWWNPARSGNGVDLHVSDQASLLYVMYTGNPDRSPAWYIANDADSHHNQYHNQVLEVNFVGGYAANNQQINVVGSSNTTFISATEAIQVRRINGQLSAEKLVVDQFAASPTPNMHTGHYFSPAENGWGQSVITLGGTRVVISYIYDVLGNPFWTISSGANDAAEKTVVTADTFCPHCPAMPIEVDAIGTLRMQFNDQTDGVIDAYNISYPSGATTPAAYWEATNLPIINLVPNDNP